ncbi:MAG: hypothetical protein MST03_06375 [Bacteroidales bacterium]|nr:hypothetical protein [Bacteroidales bacterium]
MKKFYMLIASFLMAFSVAAQEAGEGLQSVGVSTTYQYLTPLDITICSFNLEQLRDSYEKDENYAAVLATIQSRLKEEKSAIMAMQKTLKTERLLYDAQMELYKGRQALSAYLDKQMEATIKKINELILQMDKQSQILSTLDNSDEAITTHRALFEQTRKELLDAIKQSQQIKQQNGTTSSETLNQEFNRLNSFLIELSDKETRLNSLLNQNKANMEIINSTLKSTEAAIKAAAKGK